MQRLRKTANLPSSIHQQLNMYALAAGAAGVGMLALAQPVEARVVYTPTHKALPINRYFYLDLNHDHVSDFRFFLRFSTFPSSGGSLISVAVEPAQSKNGVYSVLSYGVHCAAALPKGSRVGPKSPFAVSSALMFKFRNSDAGAQSYGPWLLKNEAYLGLRFTIKGKVHYGWARLEPSDVKPPREELTGYAYETIPGKAIIAGKTKGPDDDDQPAPASLKPPPHRPATLGTLALGAPALSIWRREESVVAAPESN
jgi:hypothetical protein